MGYFNSEAPSEIAVWLSLQNRMEFPKVLPTHSIYPSE